MGHPVVGRDVHRGSPIGDRVVDLQAMLHMFTNPLHTRLTLNGLQQRRNVSSDSDQSLTKRLAETASEHEIQLVVQELRQIGADSLCEHAHTLEDGLL